MKLLWITWKDFRHPDAGGAEVVQYQLITRLAADGHQVTVLTARYPGSSAEETIDGIRYVRAGSNRYTHPLAATWYYLRHCRNKYDVVIEEVQGCAPYWTVFFRGRAKAFILYHQLARVNWLYEVPKPLSYLGYYVLAPVATWLLARSRAPVITVSDSTRDELAKYGFAPERTHIISEGLVDEPLASLKGVKKYPQPTVLSHGSMRAMKRTLEQVQAFELAKRNLPELQMKISGSSSGEYGQRVLAYIAASPYKDDIAYLGRTTDEQKTEVMQRSHAILVTSVEEGWGLIVTEANGQGTPAVVYDVAGLRDSVRNGRTGVVTAANPAALADGIYQLLDSPAMYEKLRTAAHTWSRHITFDQSYKDLLGVITA